MTRMKTISTCTIRPLRLAVRSRLIAWTTMRRVWSLEAVPTERQNLEQLYVWPVSAEPIPYSLTGDQASSILPGWYTSRARFHTIRRPRHGRQVVSEVLIQWLILADEVSQVSRSGGTCRMETKPPASLGCRLKQGKPEETARGSTQRSRGSTSAFSR